MGASTARESCRAGNKCGGIQRRVEEKCPRSDLALPCQSQCVMRSHALSVTSHFIAAFTITGVDLSSQGGTDSLTPTTFTPGHSSFPHQASLLDGLLCPSRKQAYHESKMADCGCQFDTLSQEGPLTEELPPSELPHKLEEISLISSTHV